MLAAVFALSLPAFAQPSAADKETARALMDKGDEKMDGKDYTAAIKAYEAADAIMHLPQTGVAVARAQAAAGLLVEARDKAMEIGRSPAQPGETPAFARARADAADLANKLAGRIPSIQVVIANAPLGVAVGVDGAAIPAAAALEPRKVNPGVHVVTVSAPGFEPFRAEVTVREGNALEVPVRLVPAASASRIGPAPESAPLAPPPAAAPSRKLSPLVYVGFAVGGAGLVAGAITGGLSLAKTSSIKERCIDGVCQPGTGSDISSANVLANVSNVTIGVGAAGVIVGIVGIVISKPRAPEPSAARVEPIVGPSYIGIRSTF